MTLSSNLTTNRLSRRGFAQAATLTLAAPWATRTRGAAAQGSSLRVVASFSILADWAARVGGEQADVTSIVPANGDAHTFDPDPATVAAIADADVILMMGPSFDAWMESVIESSNTDAAIIGILDHIDLNATEHHHDEDHEDDGHEHEDDHAHEHDDEHEEDEHAADDGHDHGGVDPHIWGDALLAARAVRVIVDALGEADPDNADAYQQNTDAYVAELEELDAWIHEQVDTIPEENRRIVTSHDTFGYYAAAYGFEIIGTAFGSISTEAGDPSARDIAMLVEQIEESGVPAIFAENVVNPDLMQAIADEAGVELAPALYSDALGEEGSGAATYIDMMRTNTTTIVEALGGN